MQIIWKLLLDCRANLVVFAKFGVVRIAEVFLKTVLPLKLCIWHRKTLDQRVTLRFLFEIVPIVSEYHWREINCKVKRRHDFGELYLLIKIAGLLIWRRWWWLVHIGVFMCFLLANQVGILGGWFKIFLFFYYYYLLNHLFESLTWVKLQLHFSADFEMVLNQVLHQSEIEQWGLLKLSC